MQAYGYLAVGPTSFDGGGSCSTTSIGLWPNSQMTSRRRSFTASSSMVDDGHYRNHYTVLGVPSHASSSDIKKAYRLLALKYHPDVNKGVGANEAFKSIRLAYDILINDTTRSEYDHSLSHQKSADTTIGYEWVFDPDYEDRLRFYKWDYLRREMRRNKYTDQYQDKEDEFSFRNDTNEDSEEENPVEDREPFSEVLKSAFLSIFLMQTIGIQLSLTFSSFMALVDRKLDMGYKLGYLFAWMLGGRGGILLAMFLSFASWVCGKTSSNVVALVVFAMWFGSNLARYAPLPQGALLTLLYMSIKLQVDLN